MKVTGPGGVGSTQGGAPTRRTGGSGFSLHLPQGASAPAPVAQAGPAASVASVDALLALQAAGGPLERRRRAVSRAGRILDVLEHIKVALIGGELAQADLERLKRAVREERDQTEDPKLEAVLDEIETRAAVEVAKLEGATRAA